MAVLFFRMSTPTTTKLSPFFSTIVTLSVLWTTLFNTADSAAPAAPAPAADCSSLVLNMADCLSFVTAGSTTKKPEGTCCSGLKTVLKTDAQCLCEGFKNSAQFGVTLNVTKALALPSECHVSAPSVSNCGLSIGSITAAAPALPPLGLPPSTVAGAPSSHGAANEVAPTPSLGNSGSSELVISIGMLFISTLVALSPAIF